MVEDFPYKVAITGGIGSGKSYVCAKVQALGWQVYDCDAAAKRLMRTDKRLMKQLTDLLGPQTYVDGKLNKALVAQFLLASEENKFIINRVVHPAVAEDFLNSGIRWMETAILYESGFDRFVDWAICVTAPLETRIRRIMRRDGIDRSKAEEWIHRQMPQEEVLQKADFEIVNDGVQDIDSQLERILRILTSQISSDNQRIF